MVGLKAALATLSISAPTVWDSIRGRLTMEKCDERLAWWSRRLVELADIDLHVHGADAVDWSRAYVIMSNHQSHFDVPVLFQAMRGRVRMVAKTELYRIPVFGPAMRAAGFVEVDRGDRTKAIASLRDASEKLESGTHIWIAPEGTRSKTGAIGEFKKGGFRMAVDTGTPILPVAIRGTIEVLRSGDRRVHQGKRVDVWVGAPLPVAGASLEQLMDKTREFFAQHLRP